MAIGRPIELTPNITSKNISVACTEGQTEFTVTGGYRINELAVYRNGVRLVDGRDFSATDGTTVTLISDTVVADDIVEFSVFDSFDVAGVIVSASSTQTVNGNLHVTGDLYSGDFKPTNIVATAATFNSAFHVGSALTANAAGDVETIGIITAASFSGDGTGLSGVVGVGTLNVRTESLTVSGVSTLTGVTNVTGVANFASAINANSTTDSTSTTSGSLVVQGGLGVAKNVYIGAGLSVAGTLTYEDVTSVDSVGLITAKSGVNVTGGQIQVGAAFSVGPAGVVTATSYYGDGSNLSNITSTTINNNADNRLITGSGTANTLNGESTLTYDGASLKVGSGITMAATAGVVTFTNSKSGSFDGLTNAAHFGDAQNMKIFHDGGSNGFIRINSGTLYIQGNGNQTMFMGVADGQTKMFYDGSSKIETTNDGTVTTGIATATGVDVTSNLTVGSGITFGSAGVATFSGTADVHLAENVKLKLGDPSASPDKFAIYNNGTNNWILGDGTVPIKIGDPSNNSAHFNTATSVDLYYANAKKFETTNEGIEVTGFTSTTAGMGVTGGLFEGSFISPGKLTDNKTLGISTANVFYFKQTENTTGTPNITWNDTYSLSSKMAVGDVATVTVITTAAAAGYCANWTIDGNAVTEEWVGGSAPSAGGSDGLDIYSFTIIKIGTGTGDSGWKVIGNVTNAT